MYIYDISSLRVKTQLHLQSLRHVALFIAFMLQVTNLYSHVKPFNFQRVLGFCLHLSCHEDSLENEIKE